MKTYKRSTILLFLTIATVLGPSSVHGQRREKLPGQLEGVGVTEHLDKKIDLSLPFVDEQGQKRRLKDYFDGEKPVLLTLNYANCPMLCGLQLNGLINTLKTLEYIPGREFRMVTVSIDPSEQPAQAMHKKRTYIERLGKAEAAPGWNFVVGEEKDIETLADQVGFGYRYVEETGEYAHAAVAILLTPDGRVSRYLYGVQIPERTLKFAVLEAGEGKVGSTLDQILLFCFHYDAESGTYAPMAMNIMRLGGGLVLALVGGLVFVYWRREKKKTAPALSMQS